MKNQIKVLVVVTSTKSDAAGNVYHAAQLTNPRNGKSFTTETPSLGNVRHILTDALNCEPENIFCVEKSTGSSRISSLPENIYLAACRCDLKWKKELNKIGYRNVTTSK